MKNLIYLVSATLVVFSSCQSPTEKEENETQAKMETSEIDYLAIGKDYALQTKNVLGKNLTQALDEGGPEHALTFCNTRAIPLTDSIAISLNAKIKRVSDHPRNTNNQANAQELDFINTLKANLAKGEKPTPKMAEINGKMVGYYPILTNGMCLQCHGNKQSDLTPGTVNKLAKLYPSDQATGYGDNQIRGLFVVEMDKK
jgi:hypothetical protein